MNEKSNDKLSGILLVVGIVISIILVFLLFPRRYLVLDGGSVQYESFGIGAIYSIEKRHAMCFENQTKYYEVGTIISIFRKEIYNDVHIDYDNPIPNHDEEIAEEIRNIMAYESTRESA